MRPWTKDMWWELAWVVALLTALITILWAVGCVGIEPSAKMTNPTNDPYLSADNIQTAVQTATNSNASIVNDLWPVVAIVFIGVGGLVLAKRLAPKKKC